VISLAQVGAANNHAMPIHISLSTLDQRSTTLIEGRTKVITGKETGRDCRCPFGKHA
jgi:hypothetical protein